MPLRITLELPSGAMTVYLVSMDNVANIKTFDSKQISAAKPHLVYRTIDTYMPIKYAA